MATAGLQLMSFEAAHQLLNQPYTCFKLVTATKHIALLPKFIGNFKSGILAQLNSELKFYSNALDGVLIAYSNVKRLQHTGKLIEHYPHIHMDIQADFIIFQPTVGAVLKGIVNKMGKDHIGVLVHECFNGSLPKPKFTDAGSAWPADAVSLGQEVMFKVTKLYTQAGLVSMHGNLTEESIAQLLKKKGTKRKAEEEPETPTSPSEVTHKKKKKKRDKDADLDTSMISDTSQLQSQDEMDTSAIFTSPSEAKQKKKKKKKDQDRDLDTTGLSDTSQLQSQDEMDTSAVKKSKKKKKDKDKSLGEESFNLALVKVEKDDTSDQSKKEKKKKKKSSVFDDSLHAAGDLSTSLLEHKTPVTIKVERDTASVGSNDSGVGLNTPGEASDKEKKKKHRRKSSVVPVVVKQEAVSPIVSNSSQNVTLPVDTSIVKQEPADTDTPKHKAKKHKKHKKERQSL